MQRFFLIASFLGTAAAQCTDAEMCGSGIYTATNVITGGYTCVDPATGAVYGNTLDPTCAGGALSCVDGVAAITTEESCKDPKMWIATTCAAFSAGTPSATCALAVMGTPGVTSSCCEDDHDDHDDHDHGEDEETDVVVLQFDIAGSLDDLTAKQETSIRAGIASAAGIDQMYVTVTYTAGSISVTAMVTAHPGASAAQLESAFLTNLGTTADASSALGVTVETAPTTTTTTQSAINSGMYNNIVNNFNNAVKKAVALGTTVLVVIIVVPTVVVLLIISLIVYCCCCKKKQKTTAVGGAPQSGVEITA